MLILPDDQDRGDGGSGKAGRVVVRDLAERGYEVLNIDRAPSPESNAPDSAIPYLAADVTDFGQALEALAGGDAMPGFDAVVHLAAVPSLRRTQRPIRCFART